MKLLLFNRGARWVGMLLLAYGQPAFGVQGATPPPKPHGATPSLRQLQWQELEFYGFIHFTVNTFTDKE
ncbi:MAG: hypothetical protein KJ072_06050 [Verrucomicrobia bacterium]|nr:hypothetical protein [Verrucomicrobiota bacterium]